MKLIVISHWFPYPPINGARMRTYHLIKRLAQKHEVDLFAFAQDEQDYAYVDEVRRFCSRLKIVRARTFTPSAFTPIAGLLSLRPRSSVETYSREMKASVDQALSTAYYDAAIAFTLRAAEYIAGETALSKVMDDDNAEAAYMRRLMEQAPNKLSRFRARMTWVKARMHEHRLAAKFDAVTAVSDDDRKEIAEVVPELAERKAIHVIPNGVDLALLDYPGSERNTSKLVYTGALSYAANLDAVHYFCRKVLPLVRQRIPEAALYVTGSTANVDLSDLSDIDGLVFTGFLPDIRPLVSEAAALVVPARQGGGTRLKVLEAMALGTPVVATTLGGMGFGAEDGQHLLTADKPQQFADAVVAVIRDQNLAKRLSVNAREFVRLKYGWDTISERMDEVVRLVVETRGLGRCAKTAAKRLMV